MKEEDLSNLLQRYRQMLVSRKNIYFDANEYDELADYYEKIDDIKTAKDIVDLGMAVHPNNESLMLRHARFLVYNANYTAALDFLNNHFRGYEFEFYLLKIECLLQLGLYAEAHQLTAEVVADDETDIDVILSELGFVYVEAEYFDEAILYFEKSLNYNSDNLEVLSDLVYAYESIENFSFAIKTCERILDVDPYSFEGWLALGRLYSLGGDYQKAIDAFDFALTLDDSNLNVLKLKVHCLVLSDRLSEAIDMLKQCLELAPDDEVSYASLIDCYLNVGQISDLLDLILVYESRFGETEDLIATKAYVFFLQGRYDELELLIHRVDKFDFDSFNSNLIAGDLFFRIEQYDKAISFYLKAIIFEDGVNNEELIEKLVTSYIKIDDLKSAIKYQKILLENVTSTVSLIKLALLYLELGDKDLFISCVHSFSDAVLLSFFRVFHPEYSESLFLIDRNYLLDRLDDIFESRILYKNIKY